MIPWEATGVSLDHWAVVCWEQVFESLGTGDIIGAGKLRSITYAEGLDLVKRGHDLDKVLDAYNDAYVAVGIRSIENYVNVEKS